ncbi:retrovirus-related pol polyprotein from transposon TNT 1-94 [Tanacetum coccineum]|uniref:Retrovirus-related pol polyprotein from transposon TNT 1-94 n=1 Tax=Tanacetum coccineum TaxID=301880 RepID=A0ABQ5GIU0_9ASTR
MNPQEKQQVAALDDKWVPFSERVNTSSTNIKLETTVPQKEETFQVVIDLIKNSTCFKAFTISADVPEIFMTILDICPRVEGVDFIDVPDDDTALIVQLVLRAVNVAGARENVGTPVVQKSGIQCYNCKEYGHVSRECQKPKRVKDAAYHKENMLLCKQEEAGVQLNAEQDD